MNPKVKVIKPPNRTRIDTNEKMLFLAGSIEMDKATDWQKLVTDMIESSDLPQGLGELKLSIFNPRRDDWDNSIEQKFEDPRFSQQVNWELNSLDHSTHILFYFQPGTISPVTLIEFGMNIRSNIYVVCPEGFHKKGNIDIICEREAIKQFDTLEDAVARILTDMVY